jgi:hypothetical protein
VASPEGKTLANANTTYLAKRSTPLTNPTSATIFLQADNAALAAFVAIPEDFVLGTPRPNVLSFRVRAIGRVITGASSTLISTLYYSPTARTAITTGTTGVATTGATHTSGAFATTSGNWFLTATYTWDPVSKILGGYFDAFSSGTPSVTATTVCTAVTAADLSISGPGFVVGATFGTGNAANIATLSELSLEVL